MDGSDDFRPETMQRAPDPSLQEMLRRAREARLGDTPPITTADVPSPRFVPLTTNEWRVASVRWLHSCIILVLGLLLGVLITNTAIGTCGSIGSTPASVTMQNAPSQPTDTPLLDPTDTPVPTATDTPSPVSTAGPSYPTTDDIESLAQDYIENQSDYAGSYIMTGDALLQIRSRDEMQLSVCMQFELAIPDAPDTVISSDTRLFILNPDSAGTWYVAQMGGSASCSMS